MANRQDLYLCEINGGNLRNAIPREAYAICAVPEDAKHDVRTELNIFTSEVENELAVTEPDLKLVLESETPRKMAIDQDTTTRLLKALYAAPHGVYAMSQDIPRTGRNFNQPCFCQNETESYYPHRNQPTQLYLICTQ